MRCRGALCALAIVAALGGADASQAARDQKWLGKLSTKARNLRSALETAPRRDLSEHEVVRASLATTRRDRIAALLHLSMFFPPPQALSEEEVELLKEARATALLPVSALSLSAAVGRRAPVWAWRGRESRPPPPAPPSPQEAEEEIIMLKWATVIGIAALGATFILGFLAESIHVSWAHRPTLPLPLRLLRECTRRRPLHPSPHFLSPRCCCVSPPPLLLTSSLPPPSFRRSCTGCQRLPSECWWACLPPAWH